MKRGTFLLQNALGALLREAPKRAADAKPDPGYEAWVEAQTPDAAELAKLSAEALGFTPRFYVAPDARPKSKALFAHTAASLAAQSYRCFTFGEEPNAAAFDYLLFVSEGDVLAPDALYHFAKAVYENCEPDMLFADEDATDPSGARFSPYRKAEFCEFTLLSFDCVGRPLAVKREVLLKLGGIPTARDVYAYALSCAAKSERIVHIPRVLYTRNVPPKATDYAEGRAAIDAYLKEKGMEGYASEGLYEGSFRVAVAPRKARKVAVIIPSCGALMPLRRLLESLEENTAYGVYRILIAVMEQGEPRCQTYLELLEKNKAATVLDCRGQSLGEAWCAAARAAACDALLFLSERAEVISGHWLDALWEQLLRDNVAAVGGKLLDESGRIVQAGYDMGPCGLLKNPYCGEADEIADADKNRLVNAVRAVDALSGDCLMVRRDAFAGLCMENAGADAALALCQRLLKGGHALLYTPFCRVRLHDAP